MELYNLKIKFFFIFFRKKYFSCISGGNFSSSKNKKSCSEKISCIFPKKVFLYFEKWNFLDPSLIVCIRATQHTPIRSHAKPKNSFP